MKHNPKLHHRRSIRLRGHDYSGPGIYYVTLCVKGWECVLGDIIDSEMRLTTMGEVVRECWEQVPKHFESVHLDRYIVMPNHVHGIVFIDSPVMAIHLPAVFVAGESPLPRTVLERRKMLLPKIIGWFKMNSAKRINELRSTSGSPFWHRGYYEHIVRDGDDLDRIREYIFENPVNWRNNENYARNIQMHRMHDEVKDFFPLD